jgi:hypothetical protein
MKSRISEEFAPHDFFLFGIIAGMILATGIAIVHQDATAWDNSGKSNICLTDDQTPDISIVYFPSSKTSWSPVIIGNLTINDEVASHGN